MPPRQKVPLNIRRYATPHVRFGSKADIGACRRDVRFTPKADIGTQPRNVCFVPKADIPHCSEESRYSITSSARAESVGGISNPSVFAVFRLITNWKLVGCITGRSPGFSPLRMRPA